MSADNTQDGAEPSPASAGSRNTDIATARLSAANTWLQDEIKRLRLTDEEMEAVKFFAEAGVYWATGEGVGHARRLIGMLRRLG